MANWRSRATSTPDEEPPATSWRSRATTTPEPAAKREPPKREEIGPFEAMASAAGAGLFGTGDEIGAGLQAEMAGTKRFESPMAHDKEMLDTYRQSRFENRDIDERASKDWPWLYYPVMAGSSALSSRLIPGLGLAQKGAPLGLKIVKGALAAMPTGAAFGLGGSQSDLTKPSAETIGNAAGDTMNMASLAGLFGLGGALGGAAWDTVAPNLKKAGVGIAKYVLGGDKTGVSSDAAKLALDRGAISVGGNAKSAATKLKDELALHGIGHESLMTDLESSGATGLNVADTSDRLVNATQKAWLNKSGNRAIPREYWKQNKELIDTAAMTEEMGLAPNNRLGLKQGEELKKTLQALAKYEEPNKGINAAREEIARIFKEEQEKALIGHAVNNPGNKRILSLVRQFIPSKETMGNLSEALGGAEYASRPHAARRLSWLLENAITGRIPSTVARAAYGLGKFLTPAAEEAVKQGASKAVPGAARTAIAESLLRNREQAAPRLVPQGAF